MLHMAMLLERSLDGSFQLSAHHKIASTLAKHQAPQNHIIISFISNNTGLKVPQQLGISGAKAAMFGVIGLCKKGGSRLIFCGISKSYLKT